MSEEINSDVEHVRKICLNMNIFISNILHFIFALGQAFVTSSLSSYSCGGVYSILLNLGKEKQTAYSV